MSYTITGSYTNSNIPNISNIEHLTNISDIPNNRTIKCSNSNTTLTDLCRSDRNRRNNPTICNDTNNRWHFKLIKSEEPKMPHIIQPYFNETIAQSWDSNWMNATEVNCNNVMLGPIIKTPTYAPLDYDNQDLNWELNRGRESRRIDGEHIWKKASIGLGDNGCRNTGGRIYDHATDKTMCNVRPSEKNKKICYKCVFTPEQKEIEMNKWLRNNPRPTPHNDFNTDTDSEPGQPLPSTTASTLTTASTPMTGLIQTTRPLQSTAPSQTVSTTTMPLNSDNQDFYWQIDRAREYDRINADNIWIKNYVALGNNGCNIGDRREKKHDTDNSKCGLTFFERGIKTCYNCFYTPEQKEIEMNKWLRNNPRPTHYTNTELAQPFPQTTTPMSASTTASADTSSSLYGKSVSCLNSPQQIRTLCSAQTSAPREVCNAPDIGWIFNHNTNNKLNAYRDPGIAALWDAKWKTPRQINCNNKILDSVLVTRPENSLPPNNSSVKCNDSINVITRLCQQDNTAPTEICNALNTPWIFRYDAPNKLNAYQNHDVAKILDPNWANPIPINCNNMKLNSVITDQNISTFN